MEARDEKKRNWSKEREQDEGGKEIAGREVTRVREWEEDEAEKDMKT